MQTILNFADVITGRQICFTACKIPPTDFYPSYIETPEGKMCVCPDSDYKYNDVCFCKLSLSKLVAWP